MTFPTTVDCRFYEVVVINRKIYRNFTAAHCIIYSWKKHLTLIFQQVHSVSVKIKIEIVPN